MTTLVTPADLSFVTRPGADCCASVASPNDEPLVTNSSGGVASFPPYLANDLVNESMSKPFGYTTPNLRFSVLKAGSPAHWALPFTSCLPMNSPALIAEPDGSFWAQRYGAWSSVSWVVVP